VVLDSDLATLDSAGQVSLFDARTGTRKWRVSILPEDATPPTVAGGLAHAGNLIIATSGLNDVVALKAADGTEVWRTPLAAPVRTAPTVASGHVYAVTADNELVTLDLTTGNQEWSHQGLAELTSLAGGAAPAVAGEMVLAAYSTGELVALLADNGRVLWFDSLGGLSQPFAVASLADIVARPVVDKGLVFSVSHNGTLAAINARSGQRLWSRDLGGTQQPWVVGQWLFILNNDNLLVAMARDGRVRWTRQLSRFEDPDDTDDPILWYGPVLAGGKLLLAGSHGILIEIDPTTGKPGTQIDLGAGAASAPVVASGTAFVVTQVGDVVAVR
jgi:outer membrane protein assembly factor BamB